MLPDGLVDDTIFYQEIPCHRDQLSVGNGLQIVHHFREQVMHYIFVQGPIEPEFLDGPFPCLAVKEGGGPECFLRYAAAALGRFISGIDINILSVGNHLEKNVAFIIRPFGNDLIYNAFGNQPQGDAS